MTILVISVGNSLLQNFFRPNAAEDFVFLGGQLKFKQDCIRDFLFKKLSDSNLLNGPEKIFAKFPCAEYHAYFSSKENLTNNIQKRGSGNAQYDLLPAEISSLFFYYYEISPAGGYQLRTTHQGKVTGNVNGDCFDVAFNAKDKVILLCTDSISSIFCAKMIKRMIVENAVFNSKCEMKSAPENGGAYYTTPDSENHIISIRGLDAQHMSGNWISVQDQTIKPGCGYDNLRKTISKINNKKENDHIIVIRTGGYKELSASLLILGIEYEINSFYLFEESTSFIETNIKDKDDELSDKVFGGIPV